MGVALRIGSVYAREEILEGIWRFEASLYGVWKFWMAPARIPGPFSLVIPQIFPKYIDQKIEENIPKEIPMDMLWISVYPTDPEPKKGAKHSRFSSRIS